MKILFDATELSYFLEESGHRAGVFIVALNLFRELKKQNLDITFYCNFKRYYFLKNIQDSLPEFGNIELLKENSLINKFFGKLSFIVRNCPKKIVYGVLSISRYYENLFYFENKKNKEQLKNFDIFFSPFSPPSKEIMKAMNLKRFLMLHDTIPILENNNKIPKNPRLWSYKLYNSINSNDYYLTNSENTKKDILRFFPFIKSENIKTTLLAANNNFHQSLEKSPIDSKYVFSLCTLGRRKNIEFCIRNFFDFIKRENIKDLKLVLGGSIWTKYEKQLERILSKYDRSKVILTGYLDEKELFKYYSNALMFIYPSLYEGFGLPVLEAMQCGCPVITSNTSSLPEVIGDAGIKINPLDDEEMVNALSKMYNDEFFRQLCSERGLIRAQHFSWEKCASEILSYISNKTSD